MDYKDYTIADFLEDEGFLTWVRSPTPALNSFWENWMQQYPENIRKITTAREVALSVRYRHQVPASEAELIEVWDKIKQGRYSKSDKKSKVISFSPSVLFRFWVGRFLFAVIIVGLWPEQQAFIHSPVRLDALRLEKTLNAHYSVSHLYNQIIQQQLYINQQCHEV